MIYGWRDIRFGVSSGAGQVGNIALVVKQLALNVVDVKNELPMQEWGGLDELFVVEVLILVPH